MRPQKLVPVLFLVYLAGGLVWSMDYGPHSDDNSNRRFGRLWGRYVTAAVRTGEMPVIDGVHAAEKAILTRMKNPIPHNLCHGPFWELVLYFAHKAFLPEAGERSILLLRHAANFLLFSACVAVFYRTCARAFVSWKAGLLGALLLVLHPRIFAESFYNTVDLAFLSFYAISFHTLLRLGERRDAPRALLHALSCAMLVATRAAGLLMPAATLLLGAFVLLKRPDRARTLRTCAVFAMAFAAFTILFWPYLWRDTWPHFLASVRGGTFSRAFNTQPQQGYNLAWITQTTPPAFLLLFLAGTAAAVRARLSRREVPGLRETELALLFFWAPILASAAANTYLANGWRHHYFVYPPFVLVCVFGFTRIWRWTAGLGAPRARRAACALAAALPVWGLVESASFIARNHPFEYAYFNAPARAFGRLCRDQPVDYFMMSRRQLAEYVLKTDPRERITFYFYSSYPKELLAYDAQPGRKGVIDYLYLNEEREMVHSMPREAARRLKRVRNPASADYIFHLFLKDSRPPDSKPIHVIRVNGVPISAVYRGASGREGAPAGA